MNTVTTTLSVVGGLVGLLIIAGGMYAIFSLARKDEVQKRQSGWIAEMTARLDYVEPKLEKAAAENALLRQLANPTAMLERNHTEIIRILKDQGDTLEDLVHKMEDRPHDG